MRPRAAKKIHRHLKGPALLSGRPGSMPIGLARADGRAPWWRGLSEHQESGLARREAKAQSGESGLEGADDRGLIKRAKSLFIRAWFDGFARA
jgi:hypothetical protein